MSATFKDFWEAYPRRRGARAIAEAEKRFNMAIKKGADPNHIVSSARRFCDESLEQGNVDTPFIPLASTWLNQKRWLDYAPSMQAQVERDKRLDVFMTSKGYSWNGQRWEKTIKNPRV